MNGYNWTKKTVNHLLNKINILSPSISIEI